MTIDDTPHGLTIEGGASTEVARRETVPDPGRTTPRPDIVSTLMPRLPPSGGGGDVPGPLHPRILMQISSPTANATEHGAEPGFAFTVSGTYDLVDGASGPEVSVECEGIDYPASVTTRSVTSGSYTAQVRAFHAGACTVTVTGAARGAGTTIHPTGVASVTVNVTLTQAAPTFTVNAPAAGATVALSESGANVTLTVTTANENTYGARQVSAQVDGVTTALSHVSNSTTQFQGTIHLAAMPLNARTITVKCACAHMPSVAASKSVVVNGKDAAAPHVTVTSPAASGNVLADPQMRVEFHGTAYDTQSGMRGGASSVQVSLSLNGQRQTVTPIASGDFSTWSTFVTVPSLTPLTLYMWATDAAGNTSSPVPWPFAAVSGYTPTTLQDRLSDLEYLGALMAFARDQVSTPAGALEPPDVAATVRQAIDKISVPLTQAAIAGERSINNLRIPVEILREHIAANNYSTAPGTAGEAQYTRAAYEALIAGIGTSFTELRLARGADAATRAALAQRLGIRLYGANGAARPDQLDAITLEGASLSESALETLFGLPSTALGLDPLRTVPQAQFTGWQLEAQRARWLAVDTARAGTKNYTAIVDPDVITSDDVISSAPLAADVLQLLRSRAAALAAQTTTLANARQSGSGQPASFNALIAAGLPGVVLSNWQTSVAGGADISAQLAAAGIDTSGFNFLCQLQQLAATEMVASSEWDDAIQVLVGAFRRRLYSTWLTQESTICLSPDTFQLTDTGPAVSSLRIDPQARLDWQRTLRDRIGQRAMLLSDADQLVATAEQASLPILRDALLADIAPHVAAGLDAGNVVTNLYQVDVRVNGSLRTTRIAQATATVQSLLMLVRSGDNSANSLMSSWRLTNTPELFDAGWNWLGTIDGWRAATTTFLFPETALDPALLLQTTTAGSTAPTPDFVAFAQTVMVSVLDDAAVDSAVATYEAVAAKALGLQQGLAQAQPIPAHRRAGAAPVGAGNLRRTLASGPSFHYLSGRQRANQTTLSGYSATLERTDAGLAREIFWGVPMLLAQRLQAGGDYQRALDWYWVVYPYNDSVAVSAYDVVNTEVTNAPSAPDLSFPANWTSNLNPFTLVHGRPAPYLRATLVATIGCLVDYADAEFTIDSDESIANARNLYLTANVLLDHPRLTPVTPANPGEAALPLPQLATLRQRVEAQLAKLRQGRNIAGLPRTQATISGTPINQPTPYHFKVLLARAEQLAQQAGQIEAEYLSALEKYDNKTLQVSDAQNALGVATAQLAVHAAQVQEATDGVAAAQAQKDKAIAMVSTYTSAIASPSNQYEQALFGDYSKMRDMQNVVAGAEAAIGIAQAASNGLNFWDEAFSFGGAGVAAGVEIAAYGVKLGATIALDNAQAQMQANQLQASIEERKREWQMQLASAQQDVLVAGAQLQTAVDQVTIARTEQTVAQLQDDNARATLRLLTTQFTNADLYKWMSDTLGSVYRYFLQQATATARLAQAQLAFERAEPEKTFIRSDYWTSPTQLAAATSTRDTRGLTGSERLSGDLTQLDNYAFSSDSRLLNVSQTFSLSQLLPVEFLEFRKSGQLSFATPASWFDQDFPGHYQRLVKKVRLSFVALVPPSRGVRATLSSSGISQVVTQSDGSFTSVMLRRDPCSIALTSPVNASGVFDLDPQPDMLLPFEGSGVVTTWQLSLPQAANPFDFSSISDVLLAIDYTALSDPGYRTQVVAELNNNRSRSSDRVFSMARDFPDQWYALNNPPAGAARSVTLRMRDIDFPAGIADLSTTQLALRLSPRAGDSTPTDAISIALAHGGQRATASTDATGIVSTRRGASWLPLTGDSPVGDWALSFDASADALFDGQHLDDIVLIVGWSGDAPTWL